MQTKPKQRSNRLSQDAWLRKALEVLATEGSRLLTVEYLCTQLEVSRGSFYWHFESRSAFIRSLIEFWEQRMTIEVGERIASAEGTAQERLLYLMKEIVKENAAGYDVAIRAWSAQEPLAGDAVNRVDRARYGFVRSLFEEIGFDGDELEMRTKSFVVYNAFQASLSLIESNSEREKRMLLFHRMITAPI